MRLDEEKLEALRTWGEKLREANGEELPVIGRAILLLVEEIDQLHIELWHARLQGAAATDDSAAAEEESVASSLGGRLHRVLGRHRSSEAAGLAEQPGSETEAGTPAQSWIESLRRQK
jgi:hypothetical protein